MSRVLAQQKVLILDDDPAIVTCIAHMLRRKGYGALPTTGWTEAMELVRSEQPDLLLLDLTMPSVEGPSFLQFLRSEGLSIPAIVVSAAITEEVRRGMEPLGVEAFIPKPFDLVELEAAVYRALRQGRSEDASPDRGFPLREDDVASHGGVSIDDLLFPPEDSPTSHPPHGGAFQPHPAGPPVSGDTHRPRKRSRLSPGVRRRTIRQLTLMTVSCLVIAGLLAAFNLMASKVTFGGIADGVRKSLMESSRERTPLADP